MNLNRRIRQLNDLLRQELGAVTPTSYSWQHSSTLLRHYYRSNLDGSPLYNYRANSAGLILPQRALATRLLHPELPDNWVLCAWVDEYDEIGGGHAPLTFVKHLPSGEELPDIVCLSPGEVPTREATAEVCRLLRDHHSRSLVEHRNEHDYREHRRLRYELDPASPVITPDARKFAEALQLPPERVSAPGTGALRFEGREYDELKDKIREDLGASTEPGKKRERSFPDAAPTSIRSILSGA